VRLACADQATPERPSRAGCGQTAGWSGIVILDADADDGSWGVSFVLPW
jgi:hypothetical protein